MHKEEILMSLDICLFDKNELMLKKYNKIWDKVSNTITKGFGSEHFYNEKFLRIKMNFTDRKYHKNFLNVLTYQ